MYANPVTEVLGWEKTPQSLRNTWSNGTLASLAEYPSDWPEIEYLALGAYIGDQWTSRGSDPDDGNNCQSNPVSSPYSTSFLFEQMSFLDEQAQY